MSIKGMTWGLALGVLLWALLLTGLTALAQTPPAPEATAPVTVPGDDGWAGDAPGGDAPWGFWTLVTAYYNSAATQAQQFVRDLGVTVFGGGLVVFCVIVFVLVRYIAPLLPKEALAAVTAVARDGFDIANTELARRAEEARQTATPIDDSVVQALQAMTNAMLSVVNALLPAAQAAALPAPAAPTDDVQPVAPAPNAPADDPEMTEVDDYDAPRG